MQVLLEQAQLLLRGYYYDDAIALLENCGELMNTDTAALLGLAASIEASSSHPLARAVLRECENRGIAPQPLDRVENLPGFGLVAQQEEAVIAAGNAALMEKLSIDLSAVEEKARLLEENGKTLLYFAKNKALAGLIAVADPVKDTSAAAVKELKELGCKVVILTGDNPRTADAVCKAVGADYAIAQEAAEMIRTAIAKYC